MILKPQSRAELCRQLAVANSRIEKVELAALNSLIQYNPEDMTATVETGMTLRSFQEILAKNRQWLPIDPPHPETTCLADLLAFNLFGPRRLGFGTVRDYLIGAAIVMADGQLIKAGGKVVKNVAGYDLCKLFIGAGHSLGIVVEATFKLRPLPEEESLLEGTFASLAELGQAANTLLRSRAEPIILDAHNTPGRLALVAGFAGAREDVAEQTSLARSIGLSEPATLGYHRDFWSHPERPHKLSVLPSDTLAELERLGPVTFQAHLGNGIVFYRGGTAPSSLPVPTALMNRVKNAYDPNGILPTIWL